MSCLLVFSKSASFYGFSILLDDQLTMVGFYQNMVFTVFIITGVFLDCIQLPSVMMRPVEMGRCLRCQ